MSTSEEYLALPVKARRVIEDIIKDEQLTDSVIIAGAGSAKGENYLGEITRLKIRGKEKSLDLILKIPPNVSSLRDQIPLNMVYNREYLVYSKMLPVLNRLQEQHNIPLGDRFVPARFYAGSSEDKEELLVFGDLVAEGFVMFDRLKCFDLDHLQLAVRSLARFHATSMVLREVDPQVFSKLASYTSKGVDIPIIYNMTSVSLEKLLPYIESPVDKEILERFAKGMKKTMDDCVDPELTAPYNALCHGDCWSSNFLFKYQNGKVMDMRMVDWQLARLASPITDLAYMLFLGTDQVTRTSHFSDLLDLYYQTLTLQISMMGQDVDKLYPKPVYNKQIRDIFPFGLMSAILAIPITQSNRGESPDLGKLMEGAEKGEDTETTFSPKIVTRLTEIVKDFINHKFIS